MSEETVEFIDGESATDVEVDDGAAVLVIGQVEHRGRCGRPLGGNDAHAHGSDRRLHGVYCQSAFGHQLLDSQ